MLKDSINITPSLCQLCFLFSFLILIFLCVDLAAGASRIDKNPKKCGHIPIIAILKTEEII